jgi:hypothetical protein
MERYDDFGRFVLGAEQLAVCRELLLSDSTPKQRMGVILLDSLADALLYRLMETAFLYNDGAWFSHLLPHYSKKKRDNARRHFAERLKIARDPSYETVVAGYPAVVTETDITVLTIGHSYRNAAYHRDTHNPAVLATIGKIFFKSVGALFVRSQPAGIGKWLTEGQANRLRLVGVNLDNDGLGPNVLNFRDAADGFTGSLSSGMEVAAHELSQELAEDLEFRVQEVEEHISYLSEVPGKIEEHLEWMAFWASHREDAELMRLKDARDAFLRDLWNRWNMEGEEVAPELHKKEVQVSEAYNKRFTELWKTRGTTKGTLNSIADIRKVAKRLPMKRSSASILQAYRQADEELSGIERYIDEAVAAYDEAVNQEIDRRRGK